MPLMTFCSLAGMRAGPDPEIDVRDRNFQLRKENVREISVVMLAGVHERLPHSRPPPQGMQHWRGLHEIWTGADYVQNMHKLPWGSS